MAVRFSRFDRWGKLIGTLDGVYRAEHTDELNGEDIVELSLTGEIRKGDRIVWADSLGTWHEHIVREVSEISDGDGRRRETVCENSIAELYGDFVDDIRPTNKTCASALSQVLSEGGTRWSVGDVTVDGLASCTMYRESAREALSDILKTWGGELSTTIEVSGCEVTARKVNITKRGSDRGRRFEYGKGMSEIARVYSADDVYTALYGFGKGEETGGGYGRRIDFSSQGAYGPTDGGTVHVSGRMYVENPAALEEWGRPGDSGKAHVFGSVSFTDCEDPAELMRLTAIRLDSMCQPKVSYEASVIEFAKWGYDFSDSFTGDTVAVVDSAEGFDIRVMARVTKTVRDLLDECALTQITVGNIDADASGMIADQYAEVKEVTRRSSAWDVAAFTTNSYMEQLVGRFNTRFEEGGVYKYESFEQGTVYSSVPLDEDMRPVSTPAMAFQLKGGGFRISDTVGSDGHFVWSTMADGAGIVAESIVTGILSDAEGKNFWNLDTGEFALQSYAQKESAIQTVDIEYALGDSPDSAPSTGWSTDTPQWTMGKYIWQRTVTTMADGSVGYSAPACIQGAKGEQGLPGAPGAPGRDGEDGTSVKILGSYDTIEELQAAHPTGEQGDSYIVGTDLYVWSGAQWMNVGAIKGPAGESTYVHFAYSTSSDGSAGFSVVSYDGAKYIGVRTDTVKDDSTDYRDYSWTRIQGEQGPAGTGVMNVVNYYLASTMASGVTTSTPGWTTAAQDVAPDKKYLWNYEVIQFTNDSTSATEPCIIGAYGESGEDGSDGRGISSITEYYLLSSQRTGITTSTSGWSTTPSVTTEDTPYLWNYEMVAYTDGTVVSTTPVVVGVHGAKGPQGATGTSVSGVVNYYLASSAKSGVTTLTSGWTTAVQSVSADKKYLWNYEVVRFSDGAMAATEPCIIGAYGDKGSNGAAGKGISSITEYYLTTDASSGVTTSTSGWSTTPTATTTTSRYLWNYEKVTYTDGSSTSTTPAIIGTHGATGATGSPGPAGVSVTGVTNYYLATNSSSGVTTSTSGWTTTVQSVSASKKYLWNYEVVMFSDNTTAPTAPCIIGAYGDKGETGSPGSNGINGRGISSITEYYLTTSASSGVTTSTSGWAKTPSATSTSAPYLWNHERIDYTDGTFTNTTPAIIGTHGAKGDPGSPGSKGDPGSPGEKGDTGTGVSAVVAQYYLSTSSTAQSGGSWSTSQPAWVKGKYIWTRSAVTWTDGTTTYTSPVLAQAINSANQSASDAKDAVTSLDQSLNSEGVFNRLTNNGSMQGIFLEGGQLYMNADYIKTGTLVAKKLVDPDNSANYGIVGTSGGYTGMNFYPGGKLAYNIASSMFSNGKPSLFAIRVPYTASDGTEQSAFAVSINSSSITMSNVAYSNNAKKAGSTGTYIQLQATPNGVLYYNEDKAASYKVFAVPGQCDSYPLLSGFTLYRNGGTVTLANTGAQSHTIAGNWGGKSLGTIPVGYRPPATLHFQPVAMSGKDIYLEVKSDGTCQLVNGESSSYTGIVPVSGTWAMAN